MKHFQPFYSIKTSGNEIAKKLRDRLVEVSVTQRCGLVSDICHVKFDNLPSAQIKLPKETDTIEIAMGYKSGTEDTDTELVGLGKYTVGEFHVRGPIRALDIYGNKLNWHEGFKSPKAVTWESTDETPLFLSDLVRAIASNHGFDAAVAQEYNQVVLPHIEQSESDMQLLSRLAIQHDAFMKVIEEKLLFMPKGTGKTLSGKSTKAAVITSSQLVDWRFKQQHSQLIKSVKAKYYDFEQATQEVEEQGNGDPSYQLPYIFADKASAQAAAKGKLQQFKRTQQVMCISIWGNPNIKAGSVLKIEDESSPTNGSWFVDTVQHVINGSGFLSFVTCESLNN
jgi:phage protein D